MKKYVATIDPLDGKNEGYRPFKIFYDSETGLLEMEDGEEIHDTGIIHATDEKIIDIVFGMYNGGGWEIIDCIEYEEDEEEKAKMESALSAVKKSGMQYRKDKIFYDVFSDALSQSDRDAFASDWALSSIWGDNADDADLVNRAALCGRIWDLAHLTIKDIRTSTGLTQAAFGQRFLIPARTIGNWEDGTNSCPHYTRLMLARLCGLADGIF